MAASIARTQTLARRSVLENASIRRLEGPVSTNPQARPLPPVGAVSIKGPRVPFGSHDEAVKDELDVIDAFVTPVDDDAPLLFKPLFAV